MISQRSNESGFIFIGMLALMLTAAFGALVVPGNQTGTHNAHSHPQPRTAPESMFANANEPVSAVRQASLAGSKMTTEQ